MQCVIFLWQTINILQNFDKLNGFNLSVQIEKSLQRIHQGSKNSMYTTAQSIENKVGGISGWKDLLQAVGFRFEPSLNGLPPAVFFPQSDPGDRLTQASASLQALLGMC